MRDRSSILLKMNTTSIVLLVTANSFFVFGVFNFNIPQLKLKVGKG